MTSPSLRGALALVVALVAGGCSTAAPNAPVAPGEQAGTAGRELDPARLPTLTAAAGARFVGSTPPTGNRWFAGGNDLRAAQPLELATGHAVTWLLAAALQPADGAADATLWIGGDGAGAVSAFVVQRRTDDVIEVVGIDAALLGAPGGSPSLEVAADGAWAFARVDGQAPDAPVRLLDGRRFAVAGEGRLLIDGVDEVGAVPLPDAIAVATGDGLVAVLSAPTGVYDHGVLGDPLEAGAILLLRDGVVSTELAAIGGVTEGRAPMWADLDADGLDDLLVTRSNDDVGAAIVVHRASEGPTGERVFEPSRRVDGEPIGLGGRWRHLVAVAPLPVDGRDRPHVVEVVTPHLDRILRVSRLEGDTLVPVLERPTDLVTHTIGSRDLDRAGVFDATGDGRPDLVAPTRNGQLAAHDLATGDAVIIDLAAAAASNLVVTPVAGGSGLDVGVGTAASILVFPG